MVRRAKDSVEVDGWLAGAYASSRNCFLIEVVVQVDFCHIDASLEMYS
jgi:hypothetical protein